MDAPRFATAAIHAGHRPDESTGAVNVPIYLSSTFAQDGCGVPRGGYDYARTGNPTRAALEAKLAALEGGRHGLAFASGLAAVDCALRALLRPGDHVVIPDDAYSGTFRLLRGVLTDWRIDHTAVPAGDLEALASAVGERTRLVWLESPTNPSLSILDIEAAAESARSRGARVAVDNTFASPYLQRPLALGADLVIHSTTKYLGGHSDVLGGALITDDAELHAACKYLQNAAGAVPGPLDCYLTDRGVKTLPVRMERHCDNAEAVAEYLCSRSEVAAVRYPGLADHPGHAVAAKQMRRFGGMVAFDLGDAGAARKFCEATSYFTLGESLGGVESLIEHPHSMTHASANRTALETPPGLIRLSVGIEDHDDLLDDLERAFANI
ncbi:cystathionine gamma-synthase [Glycomyces halotolerans]